MEVAQDIVKIVFMGKNFKDLLDDLIKEIEVRNYLITRCFLYPSDAADDLLCVDYGGRPNIQKKKNNRTDNTI